jgi:hypothetical protein
MITCTGDPSQEGDAAGTHDGAWHEVSAPNALYKEGDTGTTYRLFHDDQELRVRVRKDRDQVQFWVAGRKLGGSRVRTNDDGARFIWFH